jgi:hypothetical protein
MTKALTGKSDKMASGFPGISLITLRRLSSGARSMTTIRKSLIT